jgi:pyridoxamine 5'-phosphate oxidase
MVLLKGVVPERGFQFYTNFESRKSQELQANPQAQLLFYWSTFGRQIRIEGLVKKLSAAESDAYWVTRPRASRIGALASQQSRPLNDPAEMDQRVAELTAMYDGKEIPRPESWGGFELVADYFEFWEDRANRLHERVTYKRNSDGTWTIGRLWP